MVIFFLWADARFLSGKAGMNKPEIPAENTR